MIKWRQGDALQAPRRNSLIQGDALATMRGWPDACIDHCIADPPFNMSKRRGLGWAFSSHVTMAESWDRFGEDEFFQFNVEWLREVCRVVKPNGNILVFGTYHNIYQLGFILQSGLNRRVLNSIVWYKPNAQPNITARMLAESTEQLVWAVNGTPDGPKKATKWVFNYWRAKQLGGGKQQRNVLGRKPSGSSPIMISTPVAPASERKHGNHPSRKPTRLAEQLLALFTNPGEVILDPFAGSGSLGEAAIGRGRAYVLVEQNQDYYDLAQKNLRSAKSRKKSTHYWAETREPPLSESEIKVLDDVPVPQADRLSLVLQVVASVRERSMTPAELADRMETDDHAEYVERQGAYYADAAHALTWIEPDPDRHGSYHVTRRGEEILKSHGAGRRGRIREDIGKMHFGVVAETLGIDVYSGIPDEELFAKELVEWFPMAENTARRRTQTFQHWLEELRSGALG